ncbi:succinate dehydrogenase, hydrophobic membrane anchor protein [Paracoccus aminophilus]|uniref:Succinate dehydrogenase hydrophobic membrane anchor subunit n=1 Tax=Paracoccus aminophilus JCM 7686 TaxID=1367847 RepID=S5YWQ7_PARAH|nr:succinate dehydrogenase, hydrophobic membrane anchor protein [Paracoccus aminophilus]AGT09636.1 succinate dehydrogenase, hydrophobic membrane anchor protein [Paracoccus aminophilus JCM 7686]
MRYLTPRKAAEGLGASHTGTQDHWFLTVTAVALAVLTPCFFLIVGRAIGLPREEVILHFSRPVPAIITGLFIIIGMMHFIRGTRVMIDDYFNHTARKVAIILSVIFSWAVIAVAVYALARMGLGAIALV